MKAIKTDVLDVLVLEPSVFKDDRGWFMETFNQRTYADLGIDVKFVQDNHSYSVNAGVLRGLHFQNEPMAQSKLVRCTRGRILDVAVDLRVGSPTYLKHVAVTLSQENKRQLFIPKGFAHGFLTLSDDAEVQYKVDQFYSKEQDRSIRFDDPTLDIAWEKMEYILSNKDLAAPFLAQSDVNFNYIQGE